jgi:ABC-type transport system substrate-binding protein
VLKPYASLSDATQGLANGEVDLLPINKIDPQTLQPLQNNPQVNIVSVPTFDFTYIGLNLRNKPLNDLYVRRAMLYGLDRQAALNQALAGFGEGLGPGLFSSAYSTFGWSIYSTDNYGYNVAMANSLLQREGFNKTSEAFRVDPSTGQTMRTLFIMSRLSQPADVAAADLFARDMRATGLPVISLPAADTDFNLAIHTYTFDIFIDSQSSDSTPVWLYNLFYSKNNIFPAPLGTNLFGYRNPNFDRCASQFISSKDQGNAQNAVQTCQQILADDLPVLPVFSKDLLLAANRKLTISSVIGNLAETVRSTALNFVRQSNSPLPLRIGFISPFSTMDPSTTSNEGDWIALHLVTEPLLTTDGHGTLKADLVQQWASSQDGASITVILRQNAKFYNDQLITPEDLAATLNWLIKNALPSSPLDTIAQEITGAEVVNQNSVKIILLKPDYYAVKSLTHLFALPKTRLPADSSAYGFLRDLMLVSSGPFTIREFSQSEGVYLQVNGPYFGQRPQITNINAFEGDGVLPGSSVDVVSSPMIVGGQPIQNASFKACLFDRNDAATECSIGKYIGNGDYSANFQIDSRFHSGSYGLESSLFAVTPSGVFIILDEREMTLISLPLIILLTTAVVLILAVAIVKRQNLLFLLHVSRARRKRSRRRRGGSTRRRRSNRRS